MSLKRDRISYSAETLPAGGWPPSASSPRSMGEATEEFGSGQGRLWEGRGGRALRGTDGRAARSAYSTHRGAEGAEPCDAPHRGERAGTRGAEGKRNSRAAAQGGGGACPVHRRAGCWRRTPSVLLVLGMLAVWPLHGVRGNEMYVAGYNDYGQVRPTMLHLTCWVCGANPSTMERKLSQAHRICKPR